MKKKYLVIVIATAFMLGTMGACGDKGKKESKENEVEETDDSKGDDSHATIHMEDLENDSQNEVTDQHAKDFIKDMYEHQRYNDYDYLEKHCTTQMLKQLKDNYDYDGEGYAVWLFRTSGQDGNPDAASPESKILDISRSDKGDGWYSYKFLDAGWRGENLIKLIEKGDGFMIDALERVYDEPAENLE
ncbi:MAG: hypothetical protein K5683_07825 [Prevotella sp.]|nr:hypothetical protein [Prevotella sp.]